MTSDDVADIDDDAEYGDGDDSDDDDDLHYNCIGDNDRDGL